MFVALTNIPLITSLIFLLSNSLSKVHQRNQSSTWYLIGWVNCSLERERYGGRQCCDLLRCHQDLLHLNWSNAQTESQSQFPGSPVHAQLNSSPFSMHAPVLDMQNRRYRLLGCMYVESFRRSTRAVPEVAATTDTEVHMSSTCCRLRSSASLFFASIPRG
jgi:hypothetical protein